MTPDVRMPPPGGDEIFNTEGTEGAEHTERELFLFSVSSRARLGCSPGLQVENEEMTPDARMRNFLKKILVPCVPRLLCVPC